ncbi:acyl-CoA dehydrogenase [Desulfosporosinus orientis DSM 765]|uniref:Acyl-CoA dehydrogenase n=1 Tax=Desulfosporosinus orientis (strain ATCC 19365 / DSM 765 / NCIMB 8382 / VKM B-1628 / Singapore I) TaxID=768706 RepID=G7WHS5_DESOD|nr:acyl-CoA dehydrogenase family protein [Desulfosporosinus orientis]AET69637.1 acyl-CoA dehydrogenase [Desulfosporosinus orientis DSM 765]
MSEVSIYQETLDRFVKSEMQLNEQTEISWGYFQSVYKKLAELGFTEVIMLEDVDKPLLLKNMAQIFTKSSHLSLALAILWQLAVNLTVLNELEDSSEAKEALAASIVKGEAYVNWPWHNLSSGDRVYPLSFGSGEEKYFILDGDEEMGFRVSLRLTLPVDSQSVERFGWSGLKEIRWAIGEEELQDSIYLGKLSKPGFEAVQDLERFLTIACTVGLMNMALKAGYKFVTERVQFGQKIWDFQAIKHYLADAYSKYQVVNIAFAELTEYFSRGSKITGEGKELQRVGFDYVQQITDIALQVHGGSGYMREYPVQRFWRDGMLLILYGK